MRKNILIIDDDRDLGGFLQQTLAVAGFHVEIADRGAVGLRKLLSDEFDLALIDINMPEISGPNICQALRKHEKTRDLPVVMITTTFHSPEQIKAAKEEYGVDDFLFKPFTGIDLQRLLERVFKPTQKTASVPEKKVLPISEFTIPTQLHRLYVDKATGLLHLHHGEAKKVIYIKDGYPVFARSNVLGECLGRMLVREGMITQVDCDQSVEVSKQSGRLQGTVLIQMGLLTPQDLKTVLERQVTEKLLSTFAWRSGTHYFEPGKDFKKGVTQIRLSPASLILQGINRYWTIKQVDEYLYPFAADYLCQAINPKYRFQDIDLGKRGLAVLKSCQGQKRLEDILEQHPLARREVQKFITALLISEMLERHPTPQQGVVDDHADAEIVMIDEKLRHKILDDYQRIMDANYFDALGVERKSDSGLIRRAYYKLAKEYHPDRYLGSDLSREMSTKINEMFQYITQAYTVLSDPTTRTDYLDELINGPKKKLDINQVIEAEAAYQEGLALIKVRRFAAAAKALKKAVELSPEEPEYMTNFAWALFKSAPEKAEICNQAMEILLASRELSPGSYQTHMCLGYVYQAQGKERQAEKSFEVAVQTNPDCTEALRELRLINLRREQSAQSKGLFAGFGKKDK
jgi:DNA-binding response OmpR family regulator/tetratricopeptide (TPR) repeat protein